MPLRKQLRQWNSSAGWPLTFSVQYQNSNWYRMFKKIKEYAKKDMMKTLGIIIYAQFFLIFVYMILKRVF
jgi:hypothetical protein